MYSNTVGMMKDLGKRQSVVSHCDRKRQPLQILNNDGSKLTARTHLHRTADVNANTLDVQDHCTIVSMHSLDEIFSPSQQF
jgi:hypothetical protein